MTVLEKSQLTKSQNFTSAMMKEGKQDLMGGSPGCENGRVILSSSEYQVLKQRNRKWVDNPKYKTIFSLQLWNMSKGEKNPGNEQLNLNRSNSTLGQFLVGWIT